MASKSNRQKAKERQARRKAQAGGQSAAASADEVLRGRTDDALREPSVPPQPSDRDNGREDLQKDAELEVGTPPHDLGQVRLEPAEAPDIGDSDDHFDPAEDEPEEEVVATTGPRGHRGEDASEHANRPRFVQFLFAVRAELSRVQWPNRQTLVTLTGVVLGFVLIAGGYLGLLDAIFSRAIQAIL